MYSPAEVPPSDDPTATVPPATTSCPTAEQPAGDERRPRRRRAVRVDDLLFPPGRRKEGLLPQIRELALEGHSCAMIGAKLQIPKSTVHRWLQGLRQACRVKIADNAEMIADAVARYDSIYREAMEAWRGSKVDKEVRLVEDSEFSDDGGGGRAKKKNSVRTERRSGDAAFLTQARNAVDAICKLVPPEYRPSALEELMAKNLEDMNDTELDAFEAALEAENAAEEAEKPQHPK